MVLGKLEGNNPAGSVKTGPRCRSGVPAWRHQTGDTLIEATSGSTGISTAMAKSLSRSYRMVLIMPEDLLISAPRPRRPLARS